jgi:hypothetical protein
LKLLLLKVVLQELLYLQLLLLLRHLSLRRSSAQQLRELAGLHCI